MWLPVNPVLPLDVGRWGKRGPFWASHFRGSYTLEGSALALLWLCPFPQSRQGNVPPIVSVPWPFWTVLWMRQIPEFPAQMILSQCPVKASCLVCSCKDGLCCLCAPLGWCGPRVAVSRAVDGACTYRLGCPHIYRCEPSQCKREVWVTHSRMEDRL